MKNLKRSIALMLVILSMMTSNMTYANEIMLISNGIQNEMQNEETMQENAPQIYEFSLEEAVNYAMENNKDIINMKLQQDQLEYSISDVRSLRKTAVDVMDAAKMSGMASSQLTSSLKNFDSYLLRQKYTERELKGKEKLSWRNIPCRNRLGNVLPLARK